MVGGEEEGETVGGEGGGVVGGDSSSYTAEEADAFGL